MKKNKFAILFIVIASICFYLLNVWTPEYILDDYGYKFKFLNEDDQVESLYPVQTLSDIFVSQYNHYFAKHGRVIVISLVQLFTGLLSKSVFNIFNALVFCGFIYTIQKYVTKSFGSLFFLSVTVLLTVVLMPSFNETFLWMTGSINYLWTAFFTLIFLIGLEKIKDESFRPKHIGYILPGLLVGWTHEGITFPLAISLIICMLWNYKTMWKSAAFPLIVGFVMGAFLCTFSPGSMNRVAHGESLVSVLSGKIFLGLVLLTRLRVFYLLVILLILKKYIGHKDSILQFIKENSFLIGSVVLSFGVVLVAGASYGRVLFGLEFFCLLLVLKFLHGIQFTEQVRKALTIGAVSLLVIFMGVITPYSLANYQEYKSLVSQMKENKDYIILSNEVKCPFSEHILLPLDSEESEFYEGFSTRFWPYKYMAATYQRDSIICLPQRFVEDVRNHPDHYEKFYTDENVPFYALRLEQGTPVERVTFQLRKTEREEIPFYFRPLARRLQRYTATNIETDRFDKVYIDSDCYLLVGKKKTIDFRVQNLQINMIER